MGNRVIQFTPLGDLINTYPSPAAAQSEAVGVLNDKDSEEFESPCINYLLIRSSFRRKPESRAFSENPDSVFEPLDAGSGPA
jgi:hypothetical protein